MDPWLFAILAAYQIWIWKFYKKKKTWKWKKHDTKHSLKHAVYRISISNYQHMEDISLDTTMACELRFQLEQLNNRIRKFQMKI